MQKERYTKTELIEPEFSAMREAGKTRREIAEHFGLEIKQIEWWVSRCNRQQEKRKAGIMPRPKGRPRRDGQTPHQSEAAEIKRLRMENQLLRDFLRLGGRGCGWYIF